MVDKGALALTGLEEGSSGTFVFDNGNERTVIAGRPTDGNVFNLEGEVVTPLRPLVGNELDYQKEY